MSGNVSRTVWRDQYFNWVYFSKLAISHNIFQCLDQTCVNWCGIFLHQLKKPMCRCSKVMLLWKFEIITKCSVPLNFSLQTLNLLFQNHLKSPTSYTAINVIVVWNVVSDCEPFWIQHDVFGSRRKECCWQSLPHMLRRPKESAKSRWGLTNSYRWLWRLKYVWTQEHSVFCRNDKDRNSCQREIQVRVQIPHGRICAV